MNDYSSDVEHQAEVRSIRSCFFVNWREVLISIDKKKKEGKMVLRKVALEEIATFRPGSDSALHM